MEARSLLASSPHGSCELLVYSKEKHMAKRLKERQHYRLPDGREVLLLMPYDESAWLCKTPAQDQTKRTAEYIELANTLVANSVLRASYSAF